MELCSYSENYVAAVPCYGQLRQLEMVRMWTWAAIIASLASVALAHHMARARGRSHRLWFWIAILVGPLAPVALLILGDAEHRAPAN